MKYLYKKNEKKGLKSVVGKESGLDLIQFETLNLDPSESENFFSEGYECAIVIFSGKCNVVCNGIEAFSNLGERTNVFTGKATTVYIPIDTKYTIEAIGKSQLNIGICKVKAEKKYSPFVVYPKDVETNPRGKYNWKRNVSDILTSKYEGKVDKIVLGEAINHPGDWSSYPPHKHDTANRPFETCMEEIYYFKANPEQGFGVQIIYNDDLSIDECFTIRDGDSTVIKEGYHPVASAPGYEIYYLWIMAGPDGRGLAPYDDPKHKWVKAVEKMI